MRIAADRQCRVPSVRNQLRESQYESSATVGSCLNTGIRIRHDSYKGRILLQEHSVWREFGLERAARPFRGRRADSIDYRGLRRLDRNPTSTIPVPIRKAEAGSGVPSTADSTFNMSN